MTKFLVPELISVPQKQAIVREPNLIIRILKLFRGGYAPDSFAVNA